MITSVGKAAKQQAVPQLRFATTRLQTGVKIHYAEQGDPGGEPLVFVHGYPDSWFSSSRVLALLDPARCHAYAIDQRGFGDSDRPAGGYAIDDYAADVTSFLDAVGVDRATLVGHSMGTFVARQVAQVHPERVARLVLIGSAVTPVNEVTLALQETVRTLQDPVSPEFAREFAASCVHVPVPDLFLEREVAECLKAPARVWQSALDGLLAFDDAAELGRIAAPTLLQWGDRDAVFPRQEEQERLAAAIRGAQLTVYPETGHCPNWERPERVAADLDAFVRETKPTPPRLRRAGRRL